MDERRTRHRTVLPRDPDSAGGGGVEQLDREPSALPTVSTFEPTGTGADPGAEGEDPRGERRMRRLKAEPHGAGLRWSVAEAVMAAFDLLAVLLVTRSWQAALAALVSQRILGAYHHRFHLSVADGGRRVFVVSAVAVLTYVWIADVHDWRIAAAALLLTIVALMVAHGLAIATVKALRRRWPAPVLVLGGGRMGLTLVETLRRHPEYGLFPVGLVSDVGIAGLDLPVVPTSRAVPAVEETGIRELICAFGPESDEHNLEMLRSLQRNRVHLTVIPRLFDLSPAPDHIWAIPVVEVPTALSESLTRRALKRTMETVAVSVTLILVSPLMLACAVAVKATSKGPVFFRQRRTGKGGKEFMILKFRTMEEGSGGPTFTLVDDPRVTKVGKLLRRTGLDELPQLLNVLKGDMSLIGPRPLHVDHVRDNADSIPTFKDRERVRGGITGYAEAHGLRGGEVSVEERVRFDNYYIDRQSLAMDAFIMLKSLGSILRGHSY